MVFNYITYDSWWDTDVTILPELTQLYEVNVYVLSPYKTPKYKKKEVAGVNKMVNEIFRYRDRDPRSIWFAYQFFKKVRSTVRRHDCVNYYVLGQNWFLQFLLLLYLNPRNTIICIHNYEEHMDKEHKSKGVMYWMKEVFYNKFSNFHFHSKRQHDLFQQHRKGNSFFTTMPLKDFGVPKAVERNDDVVFLFFGAIRGYKKLEHLIQAANRVNKKGYKIVIAGKCDNPEYYWGLIEDDSKFECHFGFVQDEEIADYFSRSDFLVLPYNNATQSGPSLIAINYGLPIIASDTDAFKDLIINNYNGFLYQRDNVDELMNLISNIVEMPREIIMSMKKNQLIFKKQYNETIKIKETFDNFIKDHVE